MTTPRHHIMVADALRGSFGRPLLNLLASLAEFELEMIRERTVAGEQYGTAPSWLASTFACQRVAPCWTASPSAAVRQSLACWVGDDRRTLFILTASATFGELGAGKSMGQIEVVRVEIRGRTALKVVG